MKRVFKQDDNGVMRCFLLRDIDDESNPEIGIPLNPPPIERVVCEYAKEMENQLVRMGVLTYRDLMANPQAVSKVVNALRLRLIQEYKLEESRKDGKLQ